MASLGKLAAGVAHEINNPLGGIFVYANLLEEKTEKDDPRYGYIEKILTSASRTKEIVKGLLEFSRPTKLNFVSTSVNDALENVLSLLDQQGVFYHIKITKDLAASPPGVIADPTQLEQVFMNIIMNAAEAMQGTGALDIKTAVSADGAFLETRHYRYRPRHPRKGHRQDLRALLYDQGPLLHGLGNGAGACHQLRDHRETQRDDHRGEPRGRGGPPLPSGSRRGRKARRAPNNRNVPPEGERGPGVFDPAQTGGL